MQHFRAPEFNQQQFGTQYSGGGGQAMGSMGGQHMSAGMGVFGEPLGNMGMMGMGPQIQQQRQGQGQGQGQSAQFGAHETMEAHEVLSSMIEGINRFNMYKRLIQDSELDSIMSSHLQHMNQNYENLVSYLHNRGSVSSMPYHGVRKTSVKYGLRNPSPMQPSSDSNNMDDRDVAMGMLAYHKSSAIMSTMATLECADPALRQLIQNAANSCMNQAWECFMYMNQKGMYQVPTMQPNTTNTMVNSYQ